MARRFYQLPSLTALNTFDACARHGSFSDAAVELGVTPGAVSRQVKSLEEDLSCELFKRRQRGVELSAEGRDLHEVLSGCFHDIGAVCQSLRTRCDSPDVTIAATTAFATLWLLPRLSGFWSEHKDINLNHAISDNPADAGFMNADLRIRYGEGNWKGEDSFRLFGDIIYPVCGPLFAARHELHHPADLVKLPLLRLDNLDPAWTSWNTWLSTWQCDLKEASFRRFNNYVVALQAAQENQGIALGWHSLVEPLIQQGKLVRLGDKEIVAPGSYYICWDVKRSLSTAAQVLRQWLAGLSVTL